MKPPPSEAGDTDTSGASDSKHADSAATGEEGRWSKRLVVLTLMLLAVVLGLGARRRLPHRGLTGADMVNEIKDMEPPPSVAGDKDMSGASDSERADDAAGEEGRWSKRLVVLTLILLAVVLGLGSLVLLPRRGPVRTIPQPTLFVADSPQDIIGRIQYTVAPLGTALDPTRWMVTIALYMDNAARTSDANASVILTIPPGSAFTTCPGSDCTHGADIFTDAIIPFSLKRGHTSSATLTVSGQTFGYSTNGITAVVALPELIYSSPGQPSYYVNQNLPSAADYDWSSFPVSYADAHTATWTGLATSAQLSNQSTEEVAGRTAEGINHEQQDRDDKQTFLAGAVIGAAGGALIGAVQESIPLLAEMGRRRRQVRRTAKNCKSKS